MSEPDRMQAWLEESEERFEKVQGEMAELHELRKNDYNYLGDYFHENLQDLAQLTYNTTRHVQKLDDVVEARACHDET